MFEAVCWFSSPQIPLNILQKMRKTTVYEYYFFFSGKMLRVFFLLESVKQKFWE